MAFDPKDHAFLSEIFFFLEYHSWFPIYFIDSSYRISSVGSYLYPWHPNVHRTRASPSALVLTPLAISSSLIELNVISVVRIPCFICCCCLVTKLYLTLLWPQPARLLIHGISQARILEWVAISFSRGTLWPRDWTCISCIGRRILYHWATWEAPKYYFSSILIGVPVFTLAPFRVTLIQYKLHCVIFLLILSSGFQLQRGNRKN